MYLWDSISLKSSIINSAEQILKYFFPHFNELYTRTSLHVLFRTHNSICRRDYVLNKGHAKLHYTKNEDGNLFSSKNFLRLTFIILIRSLGQTQTTKLM
jgi:hypothetical protein